MAEISVYVPQIRIRAFPYPLLACDIDDIPDTLIGWSDTNGNYDVHNMIYDIPHEGSKRAGRTTAPSTNSENGDENGDESPTTGKEQDEDESSPTTAGKEQDDGSTPAASGTDAAAIPKWPIFSLIKYYPRSFDK